MSFGKTVLLGMMCIAVGAAYGLLVGYLQWGGCA